LSLGGFDPPPPTFLLVGTFPLRFNDFHIIVWFRSTSSTVVGTHPLRFNDSFYMCPHWLVSINRPWSRCGLKRSKHMSSAPQWFLYAPPIAYRLVANCLFHRLWFFCAQEAVVRTLVQFDSINFAFYHLAKCTADPPHTLYT